MTTPSAPSAEVTRPGTPAEAADATTPWRRWPTRGDWVAAVGLVALTRAVFLLAAGAFARMRGETRLDEGWLRIWRRWDADIYAKIAEHGYTGAGADPYSEAFPPGWPLLLRAGTTLGVSPTAVALVLTTVATVVAVAYLIRWTDEGAAGLATVEPDAPAPVVPTVGRRAGLLLLVFPTAVFLVAGYSEALFLAGAIPAFRAARAGRWGEVALPLAVAVTARWAGAFLAVALLVELVRQRPPRGRAVAGLGSLVVGGLPAVAYAAWLWVVRGDPLYFLEAQTLGWDRRLVGPVDSFRATWNAAGGTDALVVAWRMELAAAAVGVALLVVLARRRQWAAATFVGGMLAALMTSTWYYSLPRILLTLFPLFPLVAAWTVRGRWRLEALVLGSLPIATLGVLQFTRGGWFH